jgi:uracil phosphoribosyltransferase
VLAQVRSWWCPILRAGLGMVQPFLDMFPDVSVGYVGLERDHHDRRRPELLLQAPAARRRAGDRRRPHARDRGLGRAGASPSSKTPALANSSFVCIVASPEGVATRASGASRRAGPHRRATTASLNAKKYILPGLGDFGDRLYGT